MGETSSGSWPDVIRPASDGSFDEHETFRNELASVHPDGRRKWVYARQPSGRLYRARTVVSWFLLAFLFLAPFVRLRGEPLVLLDILNRKFVLLGLVFWPQDFYLVVLLALSLLVTLVVSSAAIGRVWCGWLCPQTVFLEMLFRKIEYVIDGSAAQQLRLDKAPLTFDKLWRRVLKHSTFFALSFFIANVFLAYIIGAPALWQIVTAPPSAHLTGLIVISVFSLLFYAVFARFREQACTLACPYGRLMSAFVDRHSITVTYDWRRGEPRAKVIRSQNVDGPARGDCIDCGQCVTVCPTGIDIRHGIQLECVNCTACIDACDDVMRRLKRPTGLIRLTSDEAVRTGHASWLTARVKAYATVWLVLVSTLATLLALRRDVDVLILRQPGTLFAALDDGAIANFYNVQVLNRTSRLEPLDYRVLTPAGATVTPLGSSSEVAPRSLLETRLLVKVPGSSLAGAATPVRFEVRAGGRVVGVIDSSFLGPGMPPASTRKAGSAP
jgi:cytochrome c oxidase accessory protein FixG